MYLQLGKNVFYMFTVLDHKLSGARWCPSPNYNARPVSVVDTCTVVDALVIHNISLPPNEFDNGYIEQFFCNQLDCSIHPYFNEIKGMEVSSHLLIKRDGETVQFVAFNHRAWHAGVSELEGKGNCNDFSIGIELEGADDIDYEDIQYQVLAHITLALQKAYPAIITSRIVGHSDIAPGRKTDPGPAFNWHTYKERIQTL